MIKCSDCGHEYTVCELQRILGEDDGIVYVGRRTRENQTFDIYVRKTNDDMPYDPFEDGFFEFHRLGYRDHNADTKLLQSLLDGTGNRLAAVVSLYRHSADIWYRMGSLEMPDERWDVVKVAGLIKPSRDAIVWWNLKRRRKGGKSVREQMLEEIDAVLEVYTAYCNGWFYCLDVVAMPVGKCPCCTEVEWHPTGSTYKMDTYEIDWLNFEIGVAMGLELKDHYELPGLV